MAFRLLVSVRIKFLGFIAILLVIGALVALQHPETGCEECSPKVFRATFFDGQSIKLQYTNRHNYPVAFEAEIYSVTEENPAGFDFPLPDDDLKRRKSEKESWSIVAPGATMEVEIYYCQAGFLNGHDLSNLAVKMGQTTKIPAAYSAITTHVASDDFPGKVLIDNGR